MIQLHVKCGYETWNNISAGCMNITILMRSAEVISHKIVSI